MMRAISRADLVSKPWDASFGLSVIKLWSSTLLAAAAVVPIGCCVSEVVVIVAIGFLWSPSATVYFIANYGSAPQMRLKARLPSDRNTLCNGTAQTPNNLVMKSGPDVADEIRRAVRPGAIGEKHNGQARFAVDPQRCARIAKM